MLISEEIQDIITEIFNIGVGRASAAISDMLGMEVSLEVPRIEFLTHEGLRAILDEKKGEYVSVCQSMEGSLSGMGVFSLPLIKGKTLIDKLFKMESQKPEFGALEIEAIQEIGNIVVSAVGSALSDLLGASIEYQLPEVLFLDNPFLIVKEHEFDENLYCFSVNQLKVEEVDVEGLIYLVFSYRNLELFEAGFRHRYEQSSHKFGELAVEEGYITASQLQGALTFQKQASQFIGEILIGLGHLTPEQRENIFQAKPYQEFSKKFGEQSLDAEYVTFGQLKEALAIQKHAKQYSEDAIGDILFKLGYLSKKQQSYILQKQDQGKDV